MSRSSVDGQPWALALVITHILVVVERVLLLASEPPGSTLPICVFVVPRAYRAGGLYDGLLLGLRASRFTPGCHMAGFQRVFLNSMGQPMKNKGFFKKTGFSQVQIEMVPTRADPRLQARGTPGNTEEFARRPLPWQMRCVRSLLKAAIWPALNLSVQGFMPNLETPSFSPWQHGNAECERVAWLFGSE